MGKIFESGGDTLFLHGVGHALRKAGSQKIRWSVFTHNSSYPIQCADAVNKLITQGETREQYIMRLLQEFDTFHQKHAYGVLRDFSDGNVRGHTRNQVSIVRRYGTHDHSHGYITSTQFDTLRLLALIHDIGETILGDVVATHKTPFDDQIEREVGEWLIGQYCQNCSGGEDQKRHQRERLLSTYAINFASEDTTKHNYHPLYHFFRAYEILSYINGLAGLFHKGLVKDSRAYSQAVQRYIPLVTGGGRYAYLPSVQSFVRDRASCIGQMSQILDIRLAA